MSQKVKIAIRGLALLALCLALGPACQDEAASSPQIVTSQQSVMASGSQLSGAASAPRRSLEPVADRNLWTYGKKFDQALPYRPNALIVRFRDEYRGRAALLAQDLGLRIKRESRIGAHLMELARAEDVPAAVERLRKDPRVRYAEPDYRIRFLNTPNDTRYDECYGLNNTGQTGGTAGADIDAEAAWDISIGSWDVIVAVLDTGVDYNHEDLAANMWTNEDEIAGNGIDDDNNGYIDDVRGWDFEFQHNNPMDDYGHGTHCAGTIGASGNNGVGVAGVNWRVTIMPLRIIGNQELDAYTLDAAESIHYAVDNGARVMSCSWWTVEHYNQTLEEAVQYAEQMDVFLVAAAGNDNRDDDDPGYNHWPSEWPYDNIIAVAATDHNDNRASFSNWGPISVDVAGPGVDILSTSWQGGYETMSGTSMATPHVAGVVALMLSIRPELTVDELKTFLFNTVDPIADLQGLTVTGGRVNAFTAMQAISGVPLPPVALAGGNQTAMTGSTVTLDGSSSFDPNQDPITYAWEFYPPGHSAAALDDTAIAAPQFDADVCGEYQAMLTVTDDGNLESQPDRARVHVMNWNDQLPVIESAHPYGDNEDQSWTITVPGAVVMGVHFASFDTEGGYDFVRLLDGDDVEWATYDGAMGEFNSAIVDGNTIKIRFTSDGSATRDGFVLDGVWWCDAGNCPPGQGDCNDDPGDGCETDTVEDDNNCGWCGHACVFDNASAECNNAMCELIACTGSYDSCDGDLGNGCEIDLDTDVDNCSACGTACGDVYPNADVACVGGTCEMGDCYPGWDDCDNNPANGCETPVVADPNNCGACGLVCNLDHASVTYCEDGTCHVGDCTVNPQNIETAHPYGDSEDLSWQIVHPGASAVTVHFSMFNTERNYDYVRLYDVNNVEIIQYWGDLGAFTSAPVPGDTVNIAFHTDGSVTRDGFVIDSSRSCVGTGCDAGWGDCDGDPLNGCETDTLSDLDHCGGCDQLCGDPNTDGSCTAGVCNPGAGCLAGWGDCNNDMIDGCETDLNNDADHCSACGSACSDAFPNADVACEAAGCVMGDCHAGWDDCDANPANGCETSVVADPDNCGACGQVCDLDHADFEYCEAGSCEIGNCQVYPEAIETEHPYPVSYDDEWLIQHAGAASLQVHFAMFETEANYDYVRLFDGQDNQIVQYWGNLGAFTSEAIPGDTVRVVFHSDSMITGAGFIIDSSRACTGSGCAVGWDDCDQDAANGCESDVSADPANCGACGASCVFDNGSGSCLNSACVIAACDANFDDCNADGWDGCETDLDTDLGHCGTCDNACSDVYPNSDVTCVSGTCEMGACNLGFADCNGNQADGCEVDLNADPDNCGACASVCDLSNASAACNSGNCVVADCDVGYGNCDADHANGCEQSVSDDDLNCGSCGMTCDLANASAHCAGVVCIIDACDAGWDDCDANERNGCEADLNADTGNCGSCDNACVSPGAVPICDQGVCAIGECAPEYADCNADLADACEAHLPSDLDNCGACDNACTDNHADSECINRMCNMGDCHAGFANCNHNNADGCEINTEADAENCGDCDIVCALPNASAACSAAVCVVATCDEDYGDCDADGENGCEEDLTSNPNRCGACDNVCSFDNASGDCVAGVCELDACDDGFDDCNADPVDGCEVDLGSDAANCSHCGVACSSGQTCQAGLCVCADADGDGHGDMACGGDDCDDSDSNVNPGMEETCEDALDNDCDGKIDEGCDTDDPDTSGGGCGCAAGGEGKVPAAWLILGLLGMLALRRKRD